MKAGLDTGIWVLACDGQKAVLLQNEGDRTYPKLVTRNIFERGDGFNRELTTDRPGRVYSGAHGVASAVETTDVHDEAERDFLKMIARDLDKMAHGHKIGGLIVCAPPRALGMVREAMSKAVKALVHAELHRDYAHLSAYDIEQHLIHALAQSA